MSIVNFLNMDDRHFLIKNTKTKKTLLREILPASSAHRGKGLKDRISLKCLTSLNFFNKIS